MGKVISAYLNCDFDVVLVKKIGALDEPEVALGAISESGDIYVNQGCLPYTTQGYIDETAKEKLELLKKRRNEYSQVHKAVDPHDRVCIIVDDGIATGATMIAAIRAILTKKPKRLIVSAPIVSTDAAKLIQQEVGVETRFYIVRDDFIAVSEIYDEFPQISDQQVLQILSTKN